jgi:nucleotidyltransferase substrate binding protein (TIGR01987 family)
VNMPLDLSSLRDAIAQAEDALSYTRSDLAKNDAGLAMHLQAGSIQAFEFTYELSIKTLKRYLQETEATPSDVEEMSFNQLIRRGYELGLLQAEIEQWRDFRRSRGLTSHTYNKEKAEGVFTRIPDFLREATFLLMQLEKRQDGLT